MKKIVVFVALTFVSMTVSFAQKEEGHIAFDIEMSSDDPEAELVTMMFNGSTMDLYFSEDVARTELNFGGMMSMVTVVNDKTEEVMILMGGFMGDKAVLTNNQEMNEDAAEAQFIIKLTKGKKKILNYKCKKAIATDANGNETTYWYTKKIKPVATDKSTAVSKLPGLALEYVANNDGMLMTFTATAVEKSLDEATKKSKLSLIIPDGYEKMTYEEFSAMGQ